MIQNDPTSRDETPETSGKTQLRSSSTNERRASRIRRSFDRDRAGGTSVRASAATGAFIRVDDGDVVNGDRVAGASAGASAATDARVFINYSSHDFSPN